MPLPSLCPTNVTGAPLSLVPLQAEYAYIVEALAAHGTWPQLVEVLHR